MRLNRVAFRYARRGPWVLNDVTLDLAPGRIIEVSGPNGAGKSTLLRLIAGILRPRRGQISGRPSRIGYAPERFPADQPFTVAAYLGFMARMRRQPQTAYAPWAARLGLASLYNVALPELSKGSAQKVGLAQALSAVSVPRAKGGTPPSELLVLDEPFAGLDTQTRADLPGLLTELAAEGTTIVVSDHQHCLADLPHIERLRVGHHSVTLLQGREDVAEGEDVTVLEVVVAVDEAEDVAAKLRADGYDVRRPPR